MNEEEFSNFIADYDAEISTDKGISESSSDDHSGQMLEIRSLYALAKSVESVLAPVKAPAFKASLGQRLARRPQERPRFRAIATRQNVVWMAVAAAGSLISIAGVILLVVRKLKTTGKREQSAAAAPI